MVKIADRSSKSIQQTPHQDSALTSAMTSDLWRCAPCRVFAVPDAMPSDMIMIMTLGPYGIWVCGFFSFRGGHTHAFGIGGHSDTPWSPRGGLAFAGPSCGLFISLACCGLANLTADISEGRFIAVLITSEVLGADIWFALDDFFDPWWNRLGVKLDPRAVFGHMEKLREWNTRPLEKSDTGRRRKLPGGVR
jgi:hypothetical protein